MKVIAYITIFGVGTKSVSCFNQASFMPSSFTLGQKFPSLFWLQTAVDLGNIKEAVGLYNLSSKMSVIKQINFLSIIILLSRIWLDMQNITQDGLQMFRGKS